MQLQANPAQAHGDVQSNEGNSGSPSLQAASVACCMQHDIACTKMSAHVEDQDVDPAEPEKVLVRGELFGGNLSEQLISCTSCRLAQQSLTKVTRLLVASCHCPCLYVRCVSICDVILMHGPTSRRKPAETQHAGCLHC